jgi:hypothetical protein
MSNRPTHTAYVVIDPPEGSDRSAKACWIEIAPLRQHKHSQGYDLIIPAGISFRAVSSTAGIPNETGSAPRRGGTRLANLPEGPPSETLASPSPRAPKVWQE